MHTLDIHTDRQTEFSSLDRVCIPCSAVKTGVHRPPAEFSQLASSAVIRYTFGVINITQHLPIHLRLWDGILLPVVCDIHAAIFSDT